MKTNKILAAAMAGLCAVSTMGVSAFAADEKVESAGAKSYKVNAAFAAPTIDVSVPEEVAAIINPYMIAVKLSDTVSYEAEGVASPKYTITNNSTDVGINIKATYSAEGLDGVVAAEADAKAGTVTGSTDIKKLAYVTLNAESPLDVTTKDTSAAGAVNKLEFAADTATVKEKTDVLMRLNAKADGKTDNAGKFWIGGAVTEEPTEKWTASDKLSINVVLDINPFNTSAAADDEEDYVGLTALSVKKSGTESITFDADTKTYTVTGAAAFDAYTIVATNVADSTVTMACPAATGGAAGSLTSGTLTVGNTLPLAVTVTVTDDNDNTKTDTYTINFTA